MVGRHIGDDRDMRALRHAGELEAGQLHYHDMVRLHLFDLRQQRAADVAAEMHRFAGRFQQPGDDGGGGGFAVRPGHAIDRRRAQRKKQFHFGRNGNPPLPRALKFRQIRFHAGGAQNHIHIVKMRQIPFTQRQLHTGGFQLVRRLPQLCAVAPVARQHLRPLVRQLTNYRQVVVPDAANGDAFALYMLPKCLYVPIYHKKSLPRFLPIRFLLYEIRRQISTVLTAQAVFFNFL